MFEMPSCERPTASKYDDGESAEWVVYSGVGGFCCCWRGPGGGCWDEGMPDEVTFRPSWRRNSFTAASSSGVRMSRDIERGLN